MSLLNLNFASCVAIKSKHSTCKNCAEICPTDVISMVEHSPVISNPLNCVECGGCISACPTEAFNLENFKPIDFFFDFVDQKNSENLISCNKNVPCLVSLSSEYLSSSAIMKQQDISLDIGFCQECEIFPKVGEDILKNVEESNLVLQALNQKIHIKTENIKFGESLDFNPNKNRRNLLKNITSSQSERVLNFNEDLTKKIRNKEIPDKRKLFLTVLNRAEIPKDLFLESSEIHFSSDKIVDNSCNNCSICYRVCPTGALNSDFKNSFIEFNNSLCVKCNLCIDVCETDSIFNDEVFDFSTFSKKEQKEKLIEFNVIRCDECENFFTSQKGEVVCHRCDIEENEAKELWSIK